MIAGFLAGLRVTDKMARRRTAKLVSLIENHDDDRRAEDARYGSEQSKNRRCRLTGADRDDGMIRQPFWLIFIENFKPNTWKERESLWRELLLGIESSGKISH